MAAAMLIHFVFQYIEIEEQYRMRSRLFTVLMILTMVLLSACGSEPGPVATSTPAAGSGEATPTERSDAMSAETPTTAAAEATPTVGEGTTPTSAPAPTNTAVVVGDPGASLLINGAGATFPVPIYTKWFQFYSQSVDTNVRFNYQPIGSGAGIQQIINQTVDFGGSDAPMTDEQLSQAPAEILHIPTVAGAVVAIYNVPGTAKGLKLSGEALADIFLGKVATWDDPAIKDQNAEMASSLTGDIAVIHRSDGSGTTNIFTDYLSAVSSEWKSSVGKGTSVKWPAGLGARGNAGVAGLVQQTPGSIGYVELAYALQNNLPYAFIKNPSGEFIEPTLDSTRLAAEGTEMPEDLRVSIVNSKQTGSYPIAGFTCIMVYKAQKNADKGAALARFLWWATHDGEAMAKDLTYASLSDKIVPLVEAKIKALDCGGSACYK
jgi:phosphate transport system substrate-binding protein